MASLTRRQLLQQGAAGGAVLGLGGLLQACGETRGHVSIAARFEPSVGTEIPSVHVRFAMWPFGDASMGYVGIEQGFFEDVGINVVPKSGTTRLIDQTPGELLSGQLDMTLGYLPLMIQSFANQPDIKMVQLHDVYIGNYVLAAPSVGAMAYDAFSRRGESFEQAARSAVKQIKGKRVALTTVGNNRAFFSTLLGFAGLTPKDLDLTVVDDAKILELARAGDVDFAMPGGAAQNVVLMNEGFFRVFGIGQLLANLPPGDPRTVTALGHPGLVGTTDYIKANTETILRFMSVYFRIIDQVLRDPAKTLPILLPHLNAATGLKLTLRECELVFRDFYELTSFERTADHLFNRRYPLQLDNVYGPQIDAAKKAGIVKPTDNLTPEDLFVGKRLYRILVDLKRRYEILRASRAPAGHLAAQAERHYRNRNYLDAYRLIKAAKAA